MDVILLERIERLGIIGDVVKVKPGYARNFLLPQKKALRATKENMTYFESQKAHIEANNLKYRQEAEKVASKMDDTVIVVIRQAGETGQLYGSVTVKDISDTLEAMKISVNRQQVKIGHPIKMLGLHPVRIALHPEVEVHITVNVAKSKEEAETQLQEAKNPAPEQAKEAAPAKTKAKSKAKSVTAEDDSKEAESQPDEAKSEESQE